MNQPIGLAQGLATLFGAADQARVSQAIQRLTLTLLALLFALELLVPFLTWKRLLPRGTVYLEHPLLFLILAVTVVRMLVFNHIPRASILVAAVTLIWSTVAIFEGQGMGATVWGWWTFFRYPLIGLFVYLQPDWPKASTQWLVRAFWILLSFELLIQVAQFATGEVPGDNLAGTFGAHGVGPLLFFLVLTLCVAFGVWIATGNWRPLLFVTVAGVLSSSLGEMKVYPIVLVLIGLVVLLLYVIKGGHWGNALLFLTFFSGLLFAFVIVYNLAVSESRGIRTIETFLDPEKVERYLNNMNYDSETGVYHLGRAFALKHGWELLQRDGTTLLFGYGLGTRSESTALGIVGEGLAESYFGLATGTSLLVMMQEIGLVGLALFGLFVLWLIWLLATHLAHEPDPDVKALCYGLIFFSIFWPLWLWYHKPWDFTVFMLLYWGLVGYLARIALVARSVRGL